MTQTEEKPRIRRRRVTFQERNILQRLALKTRPVTGNFERDKINGAVDITFTPEDGRTSQFRLTAAQSAELRKWLNDTAHYEQLV